MNEKCTYDWSSDNSIVQLFTLAHEEVTADEALFKYMTLDVVNRRNDFVKAKGDFNGREMKEYLQLYSELMKKRYEPISLSKKHSDILEKNDRIKAEIERQKQQELAEIERLKEEEAIRKAEEQEKIKLQEKINAGLDFLEEKFDDGRYKVTDFKGAKNRIENWMKKANVETLPNDEIQILITNLMRIYSGIVKEKERKEWTNPDSYIWKNIKRWIGDNLSRNLFNEMINN